MDKYRKKQNKSKSYMLGKSVTLVVLANPWSYLFLKVESYCFILTHPQRGLLQAASSTVHSSPQNIIQLACKQNLHEAKSNKNMKNLHPSIDFLYHLSSGCRGEAGAYFQRSTGESRGTTWTDRRPITGHHRDRQDK